MPTGVYKRTAACYGHKHSEEHKRKISESLKGHVVSAETKQKLREAATGHKYSAESKVKMSASAKRKPPVTEETKAKIRAVNLGKKNGPHTEETKAKMSVAHKGKKASEETKAKMSAALSGSNSYNWQGGISFEPYPPKFNKQLKQKIRERDGNVCQLCSKTREEEGRELTVHHIDYIKSHCNEDNLITLCSSCNSKINSDREAWTKHFQDDDRFESCHSE